MESLGRKKRFRGYSSNSLMRSGKGRVGIAKEKRESSALMGLFGTYVFSWLQLSSSVLWQPSV